MKSVKQDSGYDVVAIGELLIDFTTERLQEDGYPVMAAHPGGAVTNFLAPLAKYGRSVALIAKVGDDAFGRRLVRTVKECGIDADHVRMTGSAFTTLAFVTLDANGEREFSFARKPGADTMLTHDDIDFSVIDRSKILHFGSVCMTSDPSRETHRSVVEYAKRAGKLISYDPNLREPLWDDPGEAREQILWGLSRADVIKISDSEVDFLFGCSPEEGARKLFSLYRPKLVFVTMGKDGCYFMNENAHGQVRCPQGIRVVDTTGAGDIFGGSAMYRILESGKAPDELGEDELRKVTEFACTAATLSTTRLGAIPSVPDYETVLQNL
jgi:fructokinase